MWGSVDEFFRGGTSSTKNQSHPKQLDFLMSLWTEPALEQVRLRKDE